MHAAAGGCAKGQRAQKPPQPLWVQTPTALGPAPGDQNSLQSPRPLPDQGPLTAFKAWNGHEMSTPGGWGCWEEG